MNKKIILVAGGHGLLGGEFAYTLSKDDNNEVIILDLPSKKINRLIKKSRFYPIDITDEEDVKTTIYQIYREKKKINIFFINLILFFDIKKKKKNYMKKKKKEGLKEIFVNIISDLG